MGEVRRELEVKWMGRMEFGRSLSMQEEIVDRKIREPDAPDELLLLEHEPVYTIGRSPDRSSLRMLETLAHPVVTISRGGKATYHGPGQLVGYPILDLRNRTKDLHTYLRTLEEFLIHLLADFGIRAGRNEGLTGVWVENRKIASIGVGVRRWVTMHGFALNVSSDLSGFDPITPCGIDGVRMTSVENECAKSVSVEEVWKRAAELFPEFPPLLAL